MIINRIDIIIDNIEQSYLVFFIFDIIMNNSKTGLILLVLSLGAMLVPFMGSAINLALPFINNDLGLNAHESSWVPTSYMLCTAIVQIPCAKLADIYGRRKIFILGVFLFSVFSLACGFASSVFSLILFRVLTGLGSGMMFGTSTAILTSSVPAQRRGWALGIMISCVYIALAAGPFIGGVLTMHLGWQSIFYFSALVAFLVALGAIIFIKGEWKEEVKTPFDLQGTVLYSIGLFLVIYGFSQLSETIGVFLFLLGAFILFLFGKHQIKRAYPIFNIKLFLSNHVFRFSNISALINYSATMAIAFMLSLYLQYVRGLNPQDAGLVLIIQSVFQAMVSLLSGRLSDKISASLLATSGMALTTIGLILLCFISVSTSFYYLYFVLAILGIGFGLFSSPNTNIIMSSVEQKDYGMASATTGTMRLTGQSFSMGIAMMAISLTIGKASLSASISNELINSMQITFVICAVLCSIGVYTSSIRGSRN